MTRNLLVIGTVAVFGLAAAIAGAGDTLSAKACDDAAKSASATQSCCANGAATTAKADCQSVHGSMIKSAMFGPGSGSAVLNVAALGGMHAGGKSDCGWCPTGSSAQAAAAGCPAFSQASGCSEGARATTADAKGACPHDASMTAVNASVQAGQAGHASCDKTASAASGSCTRGASATMAGGHEGCEKGASASAAGCCEKGAKSAAAGEKCSESTSASLKGVVDVLPYRENKRVVLAGSYACGHCTLEKTAECAPMLKTADGKIYPLLKTARASELRSMEGKNIEVSGTIKKYDGVKFIDVKSYKVI